jgi:hypothetical protein
MMAFFIIFAALVALAFLAKIGDELGKIRKLMEDAKNG